MWILNQWKASYDYAVKAAVGAGGVMAREIYNHPNFNPLDGDFSFLDAGLPKRAAVANWFDQTVADNQKFLEFEFQQVVNLALAKWESKSVIDQIEGGFVIGAVGELDAVNKFVTTIAKGYVDVLRFGQGTLKERSIKGVGMDALRVLQILPTSATSSGVKWVAGSGRMKLLMLAPKQLGATQECTTNAAVRAALVMGMKWFAKVVDLWHEANIRMPPGHPDKIGVSISDVVRPLKNVGAKVSPVVEVSSMSEVTKAAASNPHSMVMFSATSGVVRAGEAFGPTNHTMLASAIEGGVRFYDTTGKVFLNLAEFEAIYQAARPYELAIVHESVYVKIARKALEGFGPIAVQMLALGVRQVPIMPLVLDWVAAFTDEETLMVRQPKFGQTQHTGFSVATTGSGAAANTPVPSARPATPPVRPPANTQHAKPKPPHQTSIPNPLGNSDQWPPPNQGQRHPVRSNTGPPRRSR